MQAQRWGLIVMARFTNGWVKLHRKIADNEWTQILDINSKGLFIELLLMANYKPTRATRGNTLVTIQPGQILTSIKELTARLKTSRFIVESRIKLLCDLGTITRKTDSLGTIITICKYSEYQSINDDSPETDLQTDLQTELETDLQTDLQRIKELKKVKNKKSKEGGTKNPPPPVDKFLELYGHEMRQRYGADLVITSKMKKTAQRIVQESGNLALQIPKLWVNSTNQWHTKRMHSLECLLNDLESILLCVRRNNEFGCQQESGMRQNGL